MKTILCLWMLCCGSMMSAAELLAVDGTAFNGKACSLEAPEGWQRRERMMGSYFVLINPQMGAEDGFAENLNVVLENVKAGIQGPEYRAATIQGLKMALKADILEEESLQLNGIPAERIRYSFNMGGRELDNDLYLIVKGNAAYAVTLSMMKGKSREENIKELTRIVNTFTISEE